jgi:hypothetical protein
MKKHTTMTKKMANNIQKILFDVYSKGVKQQDCNLTEVIVEINKIYELHNKTKTSQA